MCEYVSLPGYKWSSTTDETDRLPGLVCSRLETPLPGSSLKEFSTWGKIAQLIETIP